MTERSRWTYLACSCLVLICTGSIYAFSVLSGPLAQLRGWSAADVALGFAINAAIGPIPMILGGKLVDKGYARGATACGGALFGLAFVITSWVPSLAVFYLAYGVFGGIGIGFAYAGALGSTTRYFSDKRGLATGILTAANGMAAVITAPLAQTLITSHGVVVTLQVLGIGFMLVSLICGGIIRSAPEGYSPPGTFRNPHTRRPPVAGLRWQQMLSRPLFYLLLCIFGLGALSGLMVAANVAPIAVNMFGISAGTAAAFVGVYSVSNALGRFIWGAASDKIGAKNVLIAIFVLVAVMLAVLSNATSVAGFTVGLIGIGLSFGGIMGVFPSLATEAFGQRNFGVNYGILFVGYSAAAFIGPRMGASIGAADGGDFSRAFLIALAFCGAGLIATIVLRVIARKPAPIIELSSTHTGE
ncbi:OFA family MFS transporter (plasmid) [Agrobacterium radiobacter]|nr:OFA family MFS transporter [Agrobacterium tumefaciens]MQB27892.1 MFS transporter [Agrobacterium tumefaciens]NTA08333.1 OFA family MFS transporter [Agrobacterium tumefaciens]NTB16155.1 OFA family MFS transporter [Agrobacterium tumefaciens]